MSRKTRSKKQSNKEVEKKTYKNPVDSLWGKIIVWILIVGMLGTVIIGLIVALVNALS